MIDSNLINKKLTLIILFIIGLLIAIPTSVWIYKNSDGIHLEAIIKINSPLAYVNDEIPFFGDHSKGDIKSYSWNFGDGNNSKEKNPIHSFNIPGWYNVTLIIIDSKQKIDNSKIILGIQHQNISSPDIPPRSGRNILGPPKELLDNIYLSPNIKNPDVNIEMILSHPVGTFEIKLIVIYTVNDTQYGLEVYSQNITLMQQTYKFTQKIDHTYIPLEASTFSAGIVIVKGECNYTIRMEAFYSLSDCRPPDSDN